MKNNPPGSVLYFIGIAIIIARVMMSMLSAGKYEDYKKYFTEYGWDLL